MINKKLFVLSFLLLFVFLVAYNCADGKNFVTILNGANFKTDSGKNSYSFIGQPVVFATTEGTDTTSQSAFASVFYITQSSSITFKNDTGSDPFEDINVTLKVNIKPEYGGEITKIRYRFWQGENADWNDYTTSPEYDYPDFSINDDGTVDFEQSVSFSKGNPINSFMVYAQLKDGSKRWSDAYTVRLFSGLSSGVEITSPDKFTGLATIDPTIETTNYSIDLTSATITLYRGEVKVEDEGYETTFEDSVVYTATVSSSSDTYGLYKTEKGKISYVHSDIASQLESVPKTLDNNTTYTLVIKSQNNDSSTINRDYVIFKTLSGGVADILTYPSPFNPKRQKVKIRYLLAKTSNVTIRLYDKAGKVVCKLVDGEQRSAGTNEEEWDGRNYVGETLATGAYIVEIIAGSDRRYTALAIVGK